MRCLVGLCPDCGRTVVVRPDDEWTCGCGGGLLHLTACADAAGMADAIELLETVKGDAFRESDGIRRPTLAEEAADARAAAAALAEEDARCGDDGGDDSPDIIKELFRGDGDSSEPDEVPGEGAVRMFMVSPTPFPVWVRGGGWGEAACVLCREIEEIATAGFSAALKEGLVRLSAAPVCPDGDALGILMLEKVDVED